MELYQWVNEFGGSIEVCDADGVLLAMNDLAAEQEGGWDLIGTNILECHPEPARSRLKEMLASRQANIYTIEKRGQKKLIYQVPWTVNGEYRGFIEMQLPIPDEMPHYVRKG